MDNAGGAGLAGVVPHVGLWELGPLALAAFGRGTGVLIVLPGAAANSAHGAALLAGRWGRRPELWHVRCGQRAAGAAEVWVAVAVEAAHALGFAGLTWERGRTCMHEGKSEQHAGAEDGLVIRERCGVEGMKERRNEEW